MIHTYTGPAPTSFEIYQTLIKENKMKEEMSKEEVLYKNMKDNPDAGDFTKEEFMSLCNGVDVNGKQDSEVANAIKTVLTSMSEYAEQESIAFLDSIREYIRESHCDIAKDERTSKELYQLFKQQP